MSPPELSDCCGLATSLTWKACRTERVSSFPFLCLLLLRLRLLLPDESATRVPRALMLRSGPVIRAFPQSQSICKGRCDRERQNGRKTDRQNRRGGGEEEASEIMIFSGDFHTHSLCFFSSNLTKASPSFLSLAKIAITLLPAFPSPPPPTLMSSASSSTSPSSSFQML